MKLPASGLDAIGVASPCQASWDDMKGDARVRFCGLCSMNVYNLSDMSRPEAEDLLRRAEGRLCVRFFQRADGTVITQDCPVGLRAVRFVRRKLSLATASIAAFLGLGSLAGCPDGSGSGAGGSGATTGGAAQSPPPPPHAREVKGDVYIPPKGETAPVGTGSAKPATPPVAPAAAPPETTR